MAYPHASMRENVEGLLTMGIVLFAFRQFFFQPMAIPTGSAQPTFNGITCEDLRYTGQSVPNLAVQAVEWALFGQHYYEVIAEQDGELGGVSPSTGSGGITSTFRKSFDVEVGRVTYTVNTSMSEGPNDFMRHMGLANDQGTLPQRYFKKGNRSSAVGSNRATDSWSTGSPTTSGSRVVETPWCSSRCSIRE